MQIENDLKKVNGKLKHEIYISYWHSEKQEALNLLKKYPNYYIFSFDMPKGQKQGVYKIRKKDEIERIRTTAKGVKIS